MKEKYTETFYEVWKEAYNIYADLAEMTGAESSARRAAKEFLEGHALNGDILPGDVAYILSDIKETYNL